jgi:histidinol-phosphatase (PHP family)
VCLGACHSERVVLPADNHVHSEWSYDAPDGDMERTCERAVELGLPAIALTEHADHTRWRVADGTLDPFPFLARLVADGALVPPELDVEGYLSCLERCRDRFPGLRIVSGVELGEPHWHSADAARLLADGRFDRVLGSLHCLPTPDGSQLSEIGGLYRERDWGDVVRDYLAEIVRLIDGFADFAVLAHIDYAVRYWPDGEGAFDPRLYEEEFRAALRALAGSGRALELNTSGPMNAEIIGWWHDEGGDALSFGSDAHEPDSVAQRFRAAAAIADASGFRPGRDPWDFWLRA